MVGVICLYLCLALCVADPFVFVTRVELIYTSAFENRVTIVRGMQCAEGVTLPPQQSENIAYSA